MAKYRSKLEIVADILYVVRKGAQKKTHIMYKANLSYKLLSRYLTEVLDAGLVTVDKDEDCYLLTDKGQSFLECFDEYSKRRHRLEQQSNDLNKALTALESMIKENFNTHLGREIRNRA
jgi:predicted transcriptional regulator